ncbi:MAG: DivIVA domain-containing protein [Actinomycetota bacterium]|nr:DivIVA domain-containing protein [Actinomycetota bacterium]
MPLTPADVHNVAFSKPPIGKRGYNEDEVDAFLDLVEAELARLIEENNDLRNQVEQLEEQLTEAPPAPAPEPVRQVEQVQTMPVPSLLEQTAPGAEHHLQAAKMLSLAQEMADRLTAEAKVEADGMLGEARTKAEQVLSEARVKADSMVNEARGRAESMISDARAHTETLERQAREKVLVFEREAQRKHAEILSAVNQEKAGLEKKIEELRTFEREYRTRLKTYLESQLRELDGRASAAQPVEGQGSRQGFASTGFGARAEAGS